jgi:hypothetical protein
MINKNADIKFSGKIPSGTIKGDGLCFLFKSKRIFFQSCKDNIGGKGDIDWVSKRNLQGGTRLFCGPMDTLKLISQ